jgi:hypothetical protein
VAGVEAWGAAHRPKAVSFGRAWRVGRAQSAAVAVRPARAVVRWRPGAGRRRPGSAQCVAGGPWDTSSRAMTAVCSSAGVRPSRAPGLAPAALGTRSRAWSAPWWPARSGVGIGHAAGLVQLGEHDAFDLVSAEVDPGGVAAEAMLKASLFSSPPTVSGSPFQGRSDSPSSLGTTGSGSTKLGLNIALSTRTPAPPISRSACPTLDALCRRCPGRRPGGAGRSPTGGAGASPCWPPHWR